MIIDITGIPLTPGRGGAYCLGNGRYLDRDGRPIECCCDECDYLLCCVSDWFPDRCRTCKDSACPHASGKQMKKA